MARFVVLHLAHDRSGGEVGIRQDDPRVDGRERVLLVRRLPDEQPPNADHGEEGVRADDQPPVVPVDEAALLLVQNATPGDDADCDAGEEAGRAGSVVSLRQRVWPMVEAIKRAEEAGEPLFGGV